MPTVYDFTVKDKRDQDVPMSKWEGKVLLIVNTASKCGFTPQFKGLEELYEKYRDKGLVIIGFPCNQFAGQDPGTDDEIQSFCQLNYGVSFPIMKKIKVNGKEADPLYVYMKEEAHGTLGNRIKWNFTKFLVDRQGKVVRRFAPTDTPESIAPFIEELL